MPDRVTDELFCISQGELSEGLEAAVHPHCLLQVFRGAQTLPPEVPPRRLCKSRGALSRYTAVLTMCHSYMKILTDDYPNMIY